MKAVAARVLGEPESFVMEELPRAEPVPGEAAL